MGTGNGIFAGEGNMLGNGGTVSVYEPYSVSFNTMNKEVYVTGKLSHSMRKVVWKQANCTTLLGSTNGWDLGFVDGPDPHVARLNNPCGSIFRNLGTMIVYIFIADRNNGRIRSMEMTTSGVTTWAGSGGGGSTTNVDRLACELGKPLSVAKLANVLYTSEYVYSRIVRFSFVSNVGSVLQSQTLLASVNAVEGYRGKVFFTVDHITYSHQFYVIDVYSGR